MVVLAYLQLWCDETVQSLSEGAAEGLQHQTWTLPHWQQQHSNQQPEATAIIPGPLPEAAGQAPGSVGHPLRLGGVATCQGQGA